MADKGHYSHDDVSRCVDSVLDRVGKRIVLGMPLGLGKPNHFVNELYQRAKGDSSIELTICTALSLEKPRWSSDLERRFLEPFVERVFGGYVDLDYVTEMRKRKLPHNVKIREFYTKAGSYLNLKHAQQNYTSSNYTHVYRDILDVGVNVLGQMVCEGVVDGERRLSLSCNTDVTLDAARELRRQERHDGKPVAMVAEINNNLPFMYGDAIVPHDFFTHVIDNASYHTRLFGAPKMAISDADFMIGLWSSTLIRDGGTLQIGIGSLGDALVYALQLRHLHNDTYIDVLSRLGAINKFGDSVTSFGGVAPFEVGLNGCTEMFVDGYLQLIKSGIVKRKTYNDVTIQRLANQGRINEEVSGRTLEVLLEEGVVSPKLTKTDCDYLKKFGILRQECDLEDTNTIRVNGLIIENDLSKNSNLTTLSENGLGDRLKGGILIHGGFFLGPESFYKELREMSEEQRKLIHMTSVLKVNQLYENEYASEELKVLQRAHGRFVNACLMVTLTGGVVSDGLETGQMVSGVGGQYNFVSQAHALPGGRSILMCRSTRSKGREVLSNIVYNYGHITVPRHLRDIVITEYGIASLRGRCDAEIIATLLNITDSRFQEGLLNQAKAAGKIAEDYQIPDPFRTNYPERISDILRPYKRDGVFDAFPFGTDFTDEEIKIGRALKALKAQMSKGFKKVSSLGKAATIMSVPDEAKPYLKRLALAEPTTAKERMMRKLVIHALTLGRVIEF